VVAIAAADDPHIARSELAGWREETSRTFNLVVLGGDHFFSGASWTSLGAEVARLAADQSAAR
jgi:surfactin synthase thioesterase subunit